MIFRARAAMTLCGAEEALRMGQLRGLRARRADARQRRVAGGGRDHPDARRRCRRPTSGVEDGADPDGIPLRHRQLHRRHRRCRAARQPGDRHRLHAQEFSGTKAAAIKAILSGGASPHRLSLSETLLIFAEHRAFLGDEAPATPCAACAASGRGAPSSSKLATKPRRCAGKPPGPTSCNSKNCRPRRSTASSAPFRPARERASRRRAA